MRASRTATALLALGLLVGAPAFGEDAASPGFVDGSAFVDLVGEDALTVEISLHGALLRAITGIDEQLSEAAGGLEAIHAVILDLENDAIKRKIREVVDQKQKELKAKGWEAMATIREGGSKIVVMVHNDEKVVNGLVVMIVDDDDDQLVFANVSGTIDLAALGKLSEELDLPGLDKIDF